jgi:hypothetical protein
MPVAPSKSAPADPSHVPEGSEKWLAEMEAYAGDREVWVGGRVYNACRDLAVKEFTKIVLEQASEVIRSELRAAAELGDARDPDGTVELLNDYATEMMIMVVKGMSSLAASVAARRQGRRCSCGHVVSIDQYESSRRTGRSPCDHHMSRPDASPATVDKYWAHP